MESITIKFTANGQTLTGGGLYCASNTVRYIIAEFDLGDNWQGYDSVRAVWSTDFKCISTVLDPDGSCTVPHEVLERRGKVSVNLVGSILEDDELTDRLTTYPVLAITVDANAKVCGTETAEVTPSQFEQYVAIVIAEVEKVTGMTAVAQALPEGSEPTANYSDGVLTLGIPKGDTGATGNGISRVEFNEDYSLTFYFTDSEPFTTPSIRGAQGARGYGIASVEKIGSAGLVDTYRINFEDPSVPPTTFTVTNGEEGPQGPRGYTGETGNGIDRIELTDTTGAVKTYTIYFTDGSTYDFEVTDGEVTDAVLDEATIVQTNTDNVPYLFRPSGGDVRTGRKEFDTIVGGTVGWNQLFNGLATDTRDGITTEYDATTKKIKITNNSRTTNYSTGSSRGDIVSNLAIGHKYFILTQDITGVLFSESNTNTPVGKIYTATIDHLLLRVSNQYDFVTAHPVGNVVTFDFNIVDLTAYFGSATIADYVHTLESGTAGAGVAWLKENAPQLFEYHAYDAGSLVSVSNLTAHVMRDADDNVIGSYPLDSTLTLRGVPKLVDGKLKYDGDIYPPSGNGTERFTEIDLGTLNWIVGGGSNQLFSAPISDSVAYSKDGLFERFFLLTDKAPNTLSTGEAVVASDRVYVYNGGAYSDADAFKTAMNGVYFMYKKATPTTFTADPYTNPQIVDPSGTEEYVGSPIPVGHETDYPMTLTDTMPTADGNYTLNLTVANGKRSVSWT